MAEKIKLVRGDTKPQIKCTILDDISSEPQNIAGANVLLKFRAAGTAAILFSMPGYLMNGLEAADGTLNTSGIYATAGTGGRVVFEFVAGNLDLPAGPYEGELEVTFADSSVQTVYAPIKFSIREQF